MSYNSGVIVLVISNHSPNYSLNCTPLSPITITDFTLLFCRGRHGVILKCVPHVQHAYFSSANQILQALSLTAKECSKMRAARAVLLFFLIQPMSS